MNYAVLVIWKDGSEEYLKEGLGAIPAKFSSKTAANGQVKFMKMGMDDFQSINVVRYPSLKRSRNAER